VKGSLDRAAIRSLRVLNQNSERDVGIEKPIDELPGVPEKPER
jgi:hypothetical protein